MPFADWCQEAEEDVGEHQLTILTTVPANLSIGRDGAALLVPTHYASEERVAALLDRLGKPAAANFIRNKLPESMKIRSGDLGEIFATEYVGESTMYTVPIKRLRWKDHRNMSMRGDDLIAVLFPDDGSPIQFMKGETKSGPHLRQQFCPKRELPSTRTMGFHPRMPWRSLRTGYMKPATMKRRMPSTMRSLTTEYNPLRCATFFSSSVAAVPTT